MIVTWKCDNDACQESNHIEVNNKLSIAAGEPIDTTYEVSCWQCGKLYYLSLSMNAELENHELEE